MNLKAESTNNIATTIIAPACPTGTQTLTYIFGSFSDTIDFTSTVTTTNIEITSISPQSYSPAEKGVMEIHGSNFPTDTSQISVSMSSDNGNVYEMKVLSSVANLIRAGIPGGLTG